MINKNKPYLYSVCYKTNNRFAYLKDFTPTYDKWCLYCKLCC